MYRHAAILLLILPHKEMFGMVRPGLCGSHGNGAGDVEESRPIQRPEKCSFKTEVQPHVQVLSSCRLALLPVAHASSSTLFPNRNCKLVCAVLCTLKLILGAYCLGAQRLLSHLNTSCVDGNYFNINKNPTRCNSMQIFIYCRVTLHVSGVHRTHHQEY